MYLTQQGTHFTAKLLLISHKAEKNTAFFYYFLKEIEMFYAIKNENISQVTWTH